MRIPGRDLLTANAVTRVITSVLGAPLLYNAKEIMLIQTSNTTACLYIRWRFGIWLIVDMTRTSVQGVASGHAWLVEKPRLGFHRPEITPMNVVSLPQKKEGSTG